MENLQDHKINRYFFLAAILIFVVFLLASLMAFFTAFLAAVMFYVLSKSPVEWLTRKKGWKKSWAALLVILVSFFIILVPVSLLAAMLYQKASQVSHNLPALTAPFTQLANVLQERFHFTLLSDENIARLQVYVTGFISSALNQGLTLFGAIAMMYFLLYFMLVNISRMEAAIVFYLPFKRSQVELFGNELKAQTFSNAVGIPLIAVVQGLFAYISFLITGMNEAGFWAVVAGFTSVIPIVGTGLVWLPAGILMLVKGQAWQGIFILAWGGIILSSMDNVVRFALAKRMADVHPIVTVLGIIVGLQYFGITGLIFGPLIISYFIILVRIYHIEYRKPGLVKKRKPATPVYFQLPFTGRRKRKP